MSRLPWALLALLVLTYALSNALNGIGDGVGPTVAYTVFVLSFGVVGALVAARRPANPVGWILLAAGLSYVAGGFTVTYTEDAFARSSDPGGAATLAAWISKWVWMVGIAPVATFALLLFPDGRLPSRRWRPVAWLSGGAIALVVIGLAFTDGRMEDLPVDNPVGIPGAEPLDDVGAVALAAAVLLSIASLVARYRTAASRPRQQLKWLMQAGLVLGIGCAAAIGLEIAVGSSVVNLTNTIVTLSVATVPVAMGIAMLRHRLYDIDVVIRRTLVYGALTATLAAGYLSCVLLAQLVIGAESSLAIAASTLAMAGLFGPARARIQAVVDRRFYRRRYDAARTLEAFSARLRDELDLEALGADLRGVAHETLQPAHVSLWLRR